MPTVRLNYDGWLAVPAAMRQKLGLGTGDQLELELIDGGIVLRPRRPGQTTERPAAGPVVATTSEMPAAAAAAPVVKRGPGRPRKSDLPVVPPTLKARGARRKTEPATA